MSSCLSSRACGFDLEHMVKWPCSTSGRTTSNSSSPSSTLSESSNSPTAISTRKPRTPRKRPNQTYNEAAALLSMACPNIFNTIHLTKRTSNLPKQHCNFFNEPPELILPVIENSGFLLRQRIMDKPCPLIEPKVVSSCQNSGEIKPNSVFVESSDGYDDDFDTESMLDEEMEQGIDSIMGDSNSILEIDESNGIIASHFNTCYGYPMGLGFGGKPELNFGFVMRNGARALRKGDERNFGSFPTVKMVNISPPPEKFPVGKKNNKKKKVEELMKSGSEFRQGNFNSGDEGLSQGVGHQFILKLDYDAILNAWSDKGSPLPEETPQSASPGADIHARAAHIELFSENGGWMESGATRSMDNNHFKKIRYQVKNASSDRRPRCKGRFVTKPNSPTSDEET
ncbi:protein CHLOROPLAST IMPORT APPARATUS 2-like [Cynara cardunculus var. scolymus]|uniref:protein CHLOROPLAST IMPORT APPARATUS 2-like n=1 Tax=Cynara cardunculus var. scolymus TaxID=59895 RepID=UPI000D62BA0D|nr:protein CHLOROPLAST IMPORT APPARATUS 2-like [Cynara cardunculus var. scolymus]